MRTYGFLAGLTACALLAGAPCQAGEAFAAPVLAVAELDDQRGGFLVIDGLQVGFGAVMRTFVDGQLSLETRLTIDATGRNVVQTGGSAAPLDAAALAALNEAGLDLRGLASGQVQLVGDGGTAVAHDFDAGRIASFVANAANDRSIRQETAVTVELPNHGATQAEALAGVIGLRLGDDMNAAVIGASAR